MAGSSSYKSGGEGGPVADLDVTAAGQCDVGVTRYLHGNRADVAARG